MFEQLVKERYSTRKYSQKEVEQEKIDKILEAGRLAPTACNNQPQKIYVLKSKEALNKVRQFKMAFNAPVVMIVCYDKQMSWKARDGHDAGVDDACIVTTSMMFQATELGLNTLWARAFDINEMSKVLDLPSNIHPVSMLLVGYASEEDHPSRLHEDRKGIEETVEYR